MAAGSPQAGLAGGWALTVDEVVGAVELRRALDRMIEAEQKAPAPVPIRQAG